MLSQADAERYRSEMVSHLNKGGKFKTEPKKKAAETFRREADEKTVGVTMPKKPMTAYMLVRVETDIARCHRAGGPTGVAL